LYRSRAMMAKRSITVEKGARPPKRTYGTFDLSSAPLALLIALPFFYGVGAAPCRAQDTVSTPRMLEAPGLFGDRIGIFGVGTAAKRQSTTPGLSFSEVLRGNGSCAGYT